VLPEAAAPGCHGEEAAEEERVCHFLRSRRLSPRVDSVVQPQSEAGRKAFRCAGCRAVLCQEKRLPCPWD
jgi:hypothetical protein